MLFCPIKVVPAAIVSPASTEVLAVVCSSPAPLSTEPSISPLDSDSDPFAATVMPFAEVNVTPLTVNAFEARIDSALTVVSPLEPLSVTLPLAVLPITTFAVGPGTCPPLQSDGVFQLAVASVQL